LLSRGRLIQLFVFAAYGFVADSAIADITLSFDCTPAVSPSLAEKDPVVRTSIYKNSTLWRVTHIRASGDKVERTDQYRMADISDSGSLAWQGILFLRPYLKMIGRLSGDRNISKPYTMREREELKSLSSNRCAPLPRRSNVLSLPKLR
jgi:hypothetical protein